MYREAMCLFVFTYFYLFLFICLRLCACQMGFLRSEKATKQVPQKVQRTVFDFSSIGWCVLCGIVNFVLCVVTLTSCVLQTGKQLPDKRSNHYWMVAVVIMCLGVKYYTTLIIIPDAIVLTVRSTVGCIFASLIISSIRSMISSVYDCPISEVVSCAWV